MTESTTRPSGKRRLVISAGALVAAAALVTAAVFTDVANINLFGNKNGDGVGKKTFELLTQKQAEKAADAKLGDGDGTWISANSDAGIDWVLPNGTDLGAGNSSSVIIPLKNAKRGSSAGVPIKLTFNINTLKGKVDDAELKKWVTYDIAVAPVDAAGVVGAYNSVVSNVAPVALEKNQTLLDSLPKDSAAVAKVTLKISASAPNDTENKSIHPRFQVNAEVI